MSSVPIGGGMGFKFVNILGKVKSIITNSSGTELDINSDGSINTIITSPSGNEAEVNDDNELQVAVLNTEFLTILCEIRTLLVNNNEILTNISEHLEIITDEEID